MINPTKLEIDKIYNKIDKIAKKGNDNFLEYYIYVDDLVRKSKYSFLKECIEYKYDYDISYMDINTAKKESWKKILFNTNTTIQDSKASLLKSKNVYQVGLYYYKDIPKTYAKVIDTRGKGAELNPIVASGSVHSIDIISTGSGYSTSSTISIYGGVGTASATPVIRGGKVYSVQVTATGSGHNETIRVGKIEENDEYKSDVSNVITSDVYQRLIGNKTTYLTVSKDGYTYSATFSSWNNKYSYDKNVVSLYSKAIDYLLN